MPLPRSLQNTFGHFKTFPNNSDLFQTIQNISEHFRTFPNISEHFRIVRNIFRTLQNISEHFSILCCILHISNLYIFQLRFAVVMELVQPSLLGRIIGRQKLYFMTSRAGSDVDMCSKTFQNILKHFKSIVYPWNLSNKLFPWILISWPFFETSVMMFSRIIEYLLELATLWLWFCEFVSCQFELHTCPVLWGSNSPEKGCLTMKDNENHPSLRCCWNLFRMARKYICSPTTEGRDGQWYVSKRSRLHVAVHSPFHALCGKDDPLRCAVTRVSPVSGLSCVDNQYNTMKTKQ